MEASEFQSQQGLQRAPEEWTDLNAGLERPFRDTEARSSECPVRLGQAAGKNTATVTTQDLTPRIMKEP